MATADDMGASLGFWVKQTMASGEEVDVQVLFSAAAGQAVDVTSDRRDAAGDPRGEGDIAAD